MLRRDFSEACQGTAMPDALKITLLAVCRVTLVSVACGQRMLAV